uniref:Uncharacterized protein LOC111124605 n=1 Tax=Crassostrea virginica TaxID=6565 RepID=A0A8B8D8W9_CRAVI|nr:uncharacterized protein LOC111124605 [Crassostrea virginica]
MPDIDYQKLAEEILKQQRASNATFSALPAQNETSQDNNVIQEIPVIAPRATVYNQQAPASSTQNIPTDNTVSSSVSQMVSQIFSMNEGSFQFHAITKPQTDTHPSDFLGHLTSQACQLLSAALTTNTKASYKRSWNLFLQFNSSRTSLPISPSLLSIFIAYLFNSGYSPSSISSHISAISYVHKILGQSDPSDSFLVRKVVQGCHHFGPNKDS